MANINITEAQKTLFGLVGQALFSAPFDSSDTVDWDAVIRESRAQSVALLACTNYRALPVGEENAARLKIGLKKCTLANFNCYRGHKYLHELMTKNNIPYCIIKGVASARYYPDPLLRAMGDVDFYIAPPHLEKAKEVFIAEGFELSWEDHPHHFKLQKGTMRMELHFAPAGYPSEAVRVAFTEYWSDLCEKANLITFELGEYFLPSDFHHGFILLSHFQSHLISSGVGLRHVCDWAVFANSFSNEEFVSVFEAKLKRVGLWRLAQILSLAAVKHLGMPYQPWMGDANDLADTLIEEISNSGNFGRRARERYYENIFVADGRRVGSEKTRFSRAFRTLNSIVKHRWPVAKKCPILYPFGWFWFSMRFLFLLMIGKRKCNLVETYQQSGKRLKLYQNLDLLNPEE